MHVHDKTSPHGHVCDIYVHDMTSKTVHETILLKGCLSSQALHSNVFNILSLGLLRFLTIDTLSNKKFPLIDF